MLLKADKRERVDTLIDAVHRQNHSSSDGRYTHENMKLSNRARISCAFRAWMHQGRQWTQRLRTLTVLELEYLRVDDKTTAGMIISSLLRKVRRGSLRESFGAKLHAACMTAMICGPRYGSTIELQRAADATRSRARRQYTRPVTLFHKRKRKMCTRPTQGHTKFQIMCFRSGNNV
jgi:hypothetical protein